MIQGGNQKALREECATALKKIGFDGYAFGGFPLNEKNELVTDILKYTAELMPDNLPKYGLGIGSPIHLVAAYTLGYNLFDCVIPTRDARHKRLFVFKDPSINVLEENDFYDHIYYDNEKYIKDSRPVSEFCDCHLCTDYSRSYLYHLFKINDPLVFRLATIHNLRFLYSIVGKIEDI